MSTKGAFEELFGTKPGGAGGLLSLMLLTLGVGTASGSSSIDLYKLSLEELLLVNVKETPRCPSHLIDLPLEDLLQINVAQVPRQSTFLADTLAQLRTQEGA